MHKLIRLAAFTLWMGAIAILFVRSADMSAAAYKARAPKITPPPFAYIDPALIKIFTVGYKNVYDDLVQLWMVQSLVDDKLIESDKAGMDEAIQAALRVKPEIEGFYLLSCFTYLKNLDMPRACENVINTGIKLFPESFKLPVTQGYIELFVLNDRKKAAGYYAMAASKPNAPAHIQKIVTRMIREGGMTDDDMVAIIEELSQETTDEGWQKILTDRYLELKNKTEVAP